MTRRWLISYVVLLVVLILCTWQAGKRYAQTTRWEKCWDKDGIVTVDATGDEICMLPPWGMEERKGDGTN